MRKLFLLGAVILCLGVVNVASAGGPPAAFGTVLTSFTPAHVGNGRALAVNPKTGLIYYTNAGDTHIYVTDAANTAVATLTTSPAHNYGALSWDSKRGVLWGGRYDFSGAVDQIDPATGADTFQFAFSFPLGDSCYGQPPGAIDGLAYDRVSDTLWLSDDNAKHIFHVDLTGATISSSPVPTGRCNTGIAASGKYLWLNLQSGPDTPPFDIVQVAKADPSTVLEDIPFVSGGAGPEGIAVDRKSFVPNCTIWTNQYGATKLTAWADDPGCPSE